MASSELELAHESVVSIQSIFQKWDLDGSGTIERQELATVMFSLSTTMTESDIDNLLQAIDLDGDGVISFDEFLTWLMDPESKQTIGCDGWLEDLNLEEVFRPLFKVFDRKGRGVIPMEEFVECMTMIENSIAMHALPNGATLADLSITGDEGVSFDDFVQRHCEIFKQAGIPTTQVKQLVRELADSLEAIFDIQRKKAAGLGTNYTLPALQSAVKKLSAGSARLYTAKRHLISTGGAMLEAEEAEEESPPAKHLPVWQDPPRHLISLLIRTCALEHGLQLPTLGQATQQSSERRPSQRKASVSGLPRRKSASKSALRVIPLAVGSIRCVVPDMDALQGEERITAWHVQIQRNGTADDLLHYIVRDNEIETSGKPSCKLMDDAEAFVAAMSSLPNELQLFSIIKGQALLERALGDNLTWQTVESALDFAVSRELISEEAVESYHVDMLQSVIENINERPECFDYELKERGLGILDVAEEQLQQLAITPVEVLTGLMELGLIEVADDVWACILSKRRVSGLDRQCSP